MVKKFNVRNKIKLPSSSSGKGGGGGTSSSAPTTSTPTSSASGSSNAANIRAEYYASRNNTGSGNGNPFDDDSGGGRGANPFGDSRPNNRAGNSNPNPFADDSDDSGDDDPLAGFARKKAPAPTPAPTRSAPPPPPARNANPFGDSPQKPKSANPFGDDDDDNDGNNNVRKAQNGGGGRGNLSQSTSNNPFGDDDSDDEPPPMAKKPATNNNPFGDDDGDVNPKPSTQRRGPPPTSTGRKLPGRGMMRNMSIKSMRTPKSSSTQGAEPQTGGQTNPFGETRRASMPPQPQKGLSSGGEDSDPFSGEMKAKSPPQFASKGSAPNNNAGGRSQQSQSMVTPGSRPQGSAKPPPPPRAPSSRDRTSESNPFGGKESNNSNPFGDDKPTSADNSRPPEVPKPLIAQSQQSRQRQSMPPQQTRSMPVTSGGGANPFGDGPTSNSRPTASAGQGRAKRWSGLGMSARPNNGDTDSTRPILAGMDEDSLATGASSNAAGLANWLRRNKNEDEGGTSNNLGGNNRANQTYNSAAVNRAKSNNAGAQRVQQPPAQIRPKKLKKKKCRTYVTPWPFDNYHEVQEQMYEELASRAASEYSALDGRGEYASGDDDEKKDDPRGKRTPNRGRKGVGANSGGGGNAPADQSKYYERPEELPSIKEAVNDLSLVEFEKKAEERAINIVSTWLFDAGLIDELLVNGAMGGPSQGGQGRAASGSASVVSEKTSEGQEIGVNGFLVNAEGAEVKMDKETNKLRAMIQRDLSIINARLNDGVAASGLEVQELVNAVSATKDDIGRLRELTTYISDGQISDRDEFLLAKYPYLRKAINARRNINRCFRELEFFSHIPSTCERLRDDLHGGEWTAEEWATIRNVSMEHVELEVMLVEAEDSMKGGAHNFGDAVVDSFLDSHVQNVWELGEEIRMRIISGIGSAFELSMNNPAGMVALVEAVEVYERAAETFEKKRRGKDGGGERLNFTNMRAAALEQLYQDFELRGVDMFRGVHESAADLAEEEDAANTQFTAVLKAATELVTEIDIVKHQMSPCFAPEWHVEALWSSCVAHVCSNHIVQQIGGPDGQNLPELSITQLLELVAWVEYFRETIEETFPEVAEMHDAKKTYFVEERPELFAGDKRTVNMKNATDSLAWVNNMLWEVHRLAQEEFLVRTRSQTDEWLDKVYGSETVKNQSAEGKLTTSLCEDVFSFSSVQLRTIRERLSKKSDALILAVCIILSHMRSKQVHARNSFLQDLETCCAASNDFTRMSEKCEDMISELMSQCEFSEDMIATLEASSNELMGVYSSDAVYSARSVHIYVFDPIEEEIGIRLFEEDWEEAMVDNDLAISLVRTLEDFHEDLEHYMDDFMVVKSMMSLMSATVIFYAKCLLQRAEKHRNNKRPYFGDVKKALDRMTGDIKVMREYFEGLVPKMPSLKKNIEKDFEILATIHELMSVAAGFSVSDAEDFILVLQKRVRDVGITKHIVGDLWHLVAPTEERWVWELVESMEEQLVAIAPADEALALEVNDRSYVKGLRLDEMAVKLYVKSRRNRPIKATAVESIVKNWRTTWSAGAEDGNEEE